MTCAHCKGAADFFDDKVARREARRYRRRGPTKSTRLLLEAMLAEGVQGRTVLDIGGGVGAIQHEVLAAGAERVVNVDASPAYQEATRREAERRGTNDHIDYYLGDFAEVAPAIPTADFVTLDRVICCYPDMETLVGASAEHARILWGAVFPREYWAIRVGLWLVNLVFRLQGSAFRVFGHRRDEVERVLRGRGFVRRGYSRTLLWQVVVAYGTESP
jgi:predicted nicotinamide N-methyase